MKPPKRFTIKHFNRIKHLFPVQRSNVVYTDYQVMKAMLYALENGGKWRQLPKSYGNWNALYRRVNRWARSGLLTKIFELAADERTPVALMLSEGHRHDAPQGRKLLDDCGHVPGLLSKYGKDPESTVTLIADKAYEGDKTRKLATSLGYELCIPPKSNHKEPWQYDRELYKSRNEIERTKSKERNRKNEIERNFRRVKEYRSVFTRYDKLDVVYMGFVMFGFIVEALR